MTRRSSMWFIASTVVVLMAGFVGFAVLQTPVKTAVARRIAISPIASATPAPVAIATAPEIAPKHETMHEVAKGESVPAIIHRYLPETTFMTGSELESAIRQANPEMNKGIWPKPGTQILIPNYEPMPWTEKPIPLEKNFEVRAVYLTGAMAGSAKGLGIIRQWRNAGGNAVVFDLKDSDGSISVPLDHPLAPPHDRVPIRNMAKLTRYLHANGMRAIARIAIFRDELLVQHHPELAVRSRRSGEAWRENGKLVWTDPSRREIWDYNIALARYAAENGADEVQFDYVRFPAEGDQKDAHFAYENEHKDWQRSDVIVAFLDRAHSELKPYGVLFSLDVFGVMAWQRPIDLSHTGQDIARMAHHCDVLSPMIYPSHFFGMDGYTMPGDAPEHFISESMKRFQKTTAGSGVVLRPWLQAFGWKTKTYSPEYIRVQVQAAAAEGGVGFLFWNARNDYSKPFDAMPAMKAAGAKYFRGDEVAVALHKASETKPTSAPSTSTRATASQTPPASKI